MAIDDVRSEALVRETVALVREHARIRDPRIIALVAYDGEHNAGLIESLRSYLDQQRIIRAAARDLFVHPNTLRYRVTRGNGQCPRLHIQLLLDE